MRLSRYLAIYPQFNHHFAGHAKQVICDPTTGVEQSKKDAYEVQKPGLDHQWDDLNQS